MATAGLARKGSFASLAPNRNRNRNRIAVAVCVVVATAVSPRVAHGQRSRVESREVAWRDEWPRFRGWEYAVTGGALAGIGALVLFAGRPGAARPYRNPFDSTLRDALTARTRTGRDHARLVGDVGFRILNVYPYFDSLVIAGLAHGSGDTALQTSLINTESLAIAGFVSIGFERLIGRARPSAEECAKNPSHERFCGDADRYSSLLSGHTAIAFAGAGLVCAHHGNLPLYGQPGDTAACMTAFGLAISSGVARVVNDRHWSSDIVLAAALGTTAGYVLPVVLHYTPNSGAARSRGTLRRPQVGITPSFGPGQATVAVTIVD
jgi:hypothetical protein